MAQKLATPPSGYRIEDVESPSSLARVVSSTLGRYSQTVLRMRSPELTAPAVVLRHGPVAPGLRRLAEYQRLMGATLRDTLPPGFVHVLGFPLQLTLLARTDFPLPALGMVHIANRVHQARAVHASERPTFLAWAQDMRPHRRGTQIDIHMLAEADSEPVWHGVSTYLTKDAAPPGGASGAEGAPPSPPRASDGTKRTLGDAGATDRVARHLWRLPADLGKQYARISGDANPIHTSRVAAKAFGFPRPIAHGMYTAARALAAIPHEGSVWWTADFAKPVVLPTTTVLEFSALDGGEFEYRLTSGRSGKVHLTGMVG